jgi:hypothetical protein
MFGHIRVLVQQLVVRVGESQRTGVACHLPGEHGPPAGLQLSLGAVAVEETDFQRARSGVVGNDDVDDEALPGAHLPLAVGDDAGDEGDILIERKFTDARQFTAVEVAARDSS